MIHIAQPGKIDQLSTMYPSQASLVRDSIFKSTAWSTIFGVVISGHVQCRGRIIKQEEYFCIAATGEEKFEVRGQSVFFVRYGFQGLNQIGGPVESTGRIGSTDGSSTTLLIAPPRMGDAELDLLHIPSSVTRGPSQHASCRFGVVLKGCCTLTINKQQTQLNIGSVFCIEAHESYSIKTLQSNATIIMYQPEGGWGPNEHNSQKLNNIHAK